MKSKLLLMGMLMCSGAFIASAQSNSGEIQVKVEDDISDKPLVHVSLTLLNSKKETMSEIFTDSNGTCLFKAIPSGNYSLKAINLGYYFAEVTFLKVDSGKRDFEWIDMKPRADGMIMKASCAIHLNPVPATNAAKLFEQDFNCSFAHKTRITATQSNKPAPEEIAVYAMPDSNMVRIETSFDDKKSILIQAISGKQYLKETFTKHTRIDVSAFPKGMYLITITGPDKKDKTYIKLVVIR